MGCNWRAALGAPGQTGYCYKGGCHNAGTHAGELDLTPDAFLISRVLNVPAANDIECPGAMRCDPAAATCANCAMCTAPGKVLVAQGGPPNTGWIFDKIEPFIPQTTVATMTIGCGDAMPTFNTTGTANYRQEHKDCLKMFFNYIAQTPGTWPCTPPPMGGAGGGGAGGAPMAGSGGT